MNDLMEPVGPEWRALSPEEKQRVFAAWAARREAELEAKHGPVTDDGLGLRKARVPIASEVTGHLRPDGTVEPVGPATGSAPGAARGRQRDQRHDHRDRPERP